MFIRRMLPIVTVLAASGIGYNQYQYNQKMKAARAANKLLNLAGKRAVVVGGTSGIGHGVALRLAKADASVTIVGRSAKR